jgi:hypothetical protein
VNVTCRASSKTFLDFFPLLSRARAFYEPNFVSFGSQIKTNIYIYISLQKATTSSLVIIHRPVKPTHERKSTHLATPRENSDKIIYFNAYTVTFITSH